MKILQVSNRVPWPLNEGGTIGIYNYTRAFHQLGHEVTLYCLDADKHNTPRVEAQAVLEKFATTYIHPINTDVKVLPAVKAILNKYSYNVARFNNASFHEKVKELLQNKKFDVVQIEGTFAGPYLQTILAHHSGLTSLRMHNVEFEIWERLAKNEKNLLKASYLKLLARQLKQYETGLVSKVKVVVPVTDNDGDTFVRMNPTVNVFTSSTGIDLDKWKYRPSSSALKFYHLGSMEWHANKEAVEWYLEDIHPLLVKESNKYQLYLGGKGISYLQQGSYKQVSITSYVEDAYAFVENKDVCIVPLKSGSGIRIKILEAMAAGKLVISTTIGAQGINYEHEKNILIADSPEDFLDIFKKLTTGAYDSSEITKNAYELIKTEYSQLVRAEQLLDFYQTQL